MNLLSIRAKFLLFFALILGLSAYAGIPAWRELGAANELVDRLRDGSFRLTDAAFAAQKDFLLLHRHSLLIDKMARPKWQERYTKLHAQAKDELEQVARLATNEEMKAHSEKAGTLLRGFDTLIKQASAPNRAQLLESLADGVESELDAEIAGAQAGTAEAFDKIKDGVVKAQGAGAALGIGAGILWVVSLLAVNVLVQGFSRPLSEARRLASGDLERPIPDNGRGETDQLLAALETMRRKLKEQQTDLDEAAVTERLKTELERVALTDKLTGVANRRKIEDVCRDLVARNKRFKEALSVIMIDVDKFKLVNDTHGHQVGDQVLINVAEVLTKSLREIDVVGRWGGEEFIVLCPATSIIGAAKVAEKLRAALESHRFPVVNTKTASFGVAQLADGETLEQTVKRADEALYRAKENGRNRVEMS